MNSVSCAASDLPRCLSAARFIDCHQVQIDATREIAIACGQRTVPLGANCGLLASAALDEELRQQQMHPPEQKEGDGDMKEGLKLVYRLLTNGKHPAEEKGADGDKQMGDASAEATHTQVDVVFDQVQWYALWILLRLAIEAKRRRSMPQPPQQLQQPQQKPNSEHETRNDFIAYCSRVMRLLEVTKPTLRQIIASAPMHKDQQQYQSQQLWRKPQLAQAVLDASSELSD